MKAFCCGLPGAAVARETAQLSVDNEIAPCSFILTGSVFFRYRFISEKVISMASRPKRGASLKPQTFQGTLPSTISEDEIYHRLEWFFESSHNPHGPHTIPPDTAIGLLLKNLSLEDLYNALTRASQIYVPAWTSMLFHGVAIPWVSGTGAVGVRDVKTFGDLIRCLVLSYKHAGWKVI
jgi:hypothetical protein